MNLINTEEFVKPKKAQKPKKPVKPKIGCEFCNLKNECYNPKMEPWGRGELGIAIVVDNVTDQEDANNQIFSGTVGRILKKEFSKKGINVERDCTVFPMVQCYKPRKDNGDSALIQRDFNHCHSRFIKQLTDFPPELMIALGGNVIKQLFREVSISLSEFTTHGSCIPSDKYGCNVICSFDVWSFLNNKHNKDDYHLISDALNHIFPSLKEEYKSKQLDESKYTVHTNFDDVCDFFNQLMLWEEPVAFDYETTGLYPYEKGFKLLTASFALNEHDGVCVPLEHPEKVWKKDQLKTIYDLLRKWLVSNNPKWIQNQTFEDFCSRIVLGVGVNNCTVDSQVRQHIIDNRNHITAQKFQCFVRYGTNYDKDIDQANLRNTPLDVVAQYNVMDVRYLQKWIRDMEVQMEDRLHYPEKLFMKAMPSFSNMKERGIKVDREKLKKLDESVINEIEELNAVGKDAEFLKKYKDKFDQEFSETSNQRKQRLYFDLLNLEPLKATKTGFSTDKESMEHILTQVDRDSEIGKYIRKGLDLAKLNKLKNTYIKALQNLIDNEGYIHPSFMLHRVSSYRSSSADPNFQNIPVRDPVLARIREVLVPRNGYFLECDYSANEVKYLATITQDQNLIDDLNSGLDPHRHFASKLYEKPESEINKDERYAAKNGFVFPEFYGSWWKSIAPKYPQWKPRTIEKTEKALWSRYKKVKQWHFDLNDEYDRNGFIVTPLGFRYYWGTSGLMTSNNKKNSPIQGTAFHRLLWAIPEIDAVFMERGYKSLILGQIHDSLFIDLDINEIDDVMDCIDMYMLCNAWRWDDKVEKEIEYKIGKDFLNMEKI